MSTLVYRKAFILLLAFSMLSMRTTLSSGIESESYKIQKFWDADINFVFHYQVAHNACGPASVQMVLDFYDVEPLRSQEELALAMNTTIYEYTNTDYISKPFKDEDIEIVFDGHLSNNFSKALEQLKGNISLNRPAIVLVWYDSSNRTGHYRVTTGYNQTGLFLHDPWNPNLSQAQYSGPNLFFDNDLFEMLWMYRSNWVLILESGKAYSPTPQPSPDSNLIPVLVLFFVCMTIGIVLLSYVKLRKEKTPPLLVDPTSPSHCVHVRQRICYTCRYSGFKIKGYFK